MDLMTLETNRFTPVKSFISNTEVDGTQVLRVVKDPAITEVDEPTFARLNDVEFHNCIIEVQARSRLLVDDDMARGFIGVAFRINENNTAFECIYLRPANGRCDDQVRRNRSMQYFSYPDYKFDRFRSECPGKYEAYADIGLDEWIDLRIEIKGEQAKLYLNNSVRPVLLVNDLKHGGGGKGAIGLWVDVASEAFFRNLRIRPFDLRAE